MPGPLLTQFTLRAVSCFEFWLYLCRGLAHALSVLLSCSWAPVCAWHRHAPDTSWGGCCISICFLSLHHCLILVEHVLSHCLCPRTLQSPWPQFSYELQFICFSRADSPTLSLATPNSTGTPPPRPAPGSEAGNTVVSDLVETDRFWVLVGSH